MTSYRECIRKREGTGAWCSQISFEDVLTLGGNEAALFEVSQAEQRRRFLSRINEGWKVWKLSPIDLESHRR